MSGHSSGFDSVLDLCENRHRRIVLAVLAAERRSLTLNDLTHTVLKYNHHTPLTEASEDEVTETRLSLYHVHLPRLVSEGIISYDSDRHIAEPTERFERVLPTLSAVLDADPELEMPIEL